MQNRLTALIILDGYGVSSERKGNALGVDGTSYISYLKQNYTHTTLKTSGVAVGLQAGQAGDCNVGHLNIGAGRIVPQQCAIVDKHISGGAFYTNAVLVSQLEKVRKNNKKVHLIGMISDKGHFAKITHIQELIKLAKQQGVSDVVIHGIVDDSATPSTTIRLVKRLQAVTSQLQYGTVGTICGSDSLASYDTLLPLYDTLVVGKDICPQSVEEFLTTAESNKTKFSTLPPTAFSDKKICNGDGIVFYDTVANLTQKLQDVFAKDKFTGFSLKGKKRKVSCSTFSQTSQNEAVSVAFPFEPVYNTLCQAVSEQGLRVARVCQSTNYNKIMSLVSGGVDTKFDNEIRLVVEAPNCTTYDLEPAMSTNELVWRVTSEIDRDKFDLLVVGLDNCQLVADTGNLEATKCAAQAVDDAVRQIVEAVLRKGGRAIITADHGIAENLNKQPVYGLPTNTNNVPFVLVDQQLRDKLDLHQGSLCDVATTVLQLMDLQIPAEMTGKMLVYYK